MNEIFWSRYFFYEINLLFFTFLLHLTIYLVISLIGKKYKI